MSNYFPLKPMVYAQYRPLLVNLGLDFFVMVVLYIYLSLHLIIYVLLVYESYYSYAHIQYQANRNKKF